LASAPSVNADGSTTPVEPPEGAAVATGTDVRLLFIAGSGHSGSTLLEMFLAGHPEMAAVGELHNLSHQIAIGRPCSCGVLPTQCGRWRAVADEIRARSGVDLFERPFAFRVSRERPRNLLELAIRNWNRALYYAHFRGGLPSRFGLPRLAFGGGTLAANTELVSSIVRRLAGARILIDSSKDYVRVRERYSPAAPGSVKVVYLCRDGRGVVWSDRKHHGASVWHAAKEWAKSQRRFRAMLRGVRAEDRLDLRYEDLCADAEGSLRRVCAWLGLPFAKVMLELSPREHHTIAGNKIRLQRAMNVRVDEAWRRKLSAGQLRVFDLIAGAENRRLGYPRR
jgi:hypothetical protein